MNIDREYRVTFVADYFDMTVNLQGVETIKEDEIIELAQNIIKTHYGFDPVPFATIDIEVQEG